MNNKKGFSIIEIIIAISIIVLLAVIGINSKKGYDENVSNTKVVADTKTINNALEQYIQENKTLPTPGGNINYFKIDTSYAHAYEDADTFGVYGSLTEDTIPKQYLDVIPLDPRTHSYYAYGKAKNTNEFEVASIQVIDGNVVSKVIGNYAAENGPYNLIREYNGPNFVYNGSETNFPYNPDELIMIATDKDKNVYREGDTIIVPAGTEKEIFFSDGSVSVLGDPSSETRVTLNKLNFKGKDNLNTLVKLGLEAGQIWTKATKLNDNSEFEVYTSDSSAAVRGTIFGITKAADTDVVVLEGEVAVLETATTDTPDTIDASGSLEETVIENDVEVKKYKGIKIIEKVKVNKHDKEHPENKKAKKKKLKKYSGNVISQTTIPSSEENKAIFDSVEVVAPEYSVDPKTQTEEYKKRIEEFNNSILKLNEDTIPTKNIEIACTTFEGLNGECIENNMGTGWDIYAYAPYDVSGDLTMYGTGNFTVNSGAIIYPQDTNNVINLPSYCDTNSSNKFNSFCKISDSLKGVFIDNDENNDFIKYSGLNLGDDFAIEMNVKFPMNNPNSDRYLFDFNNTLKAYFDYNYGKLFIKNSTAIFSAIDLSTYYDGMFHNIVLKNEKGNYSLYIDKNNLGTNIINNYPIYDNGSILYIGSKNDNSKQFNDIIDYVKIYKKIPIVNTGNSGGTTDIYQSQNQ